MRSIYCGMIIFLLLGTIGIVSALEPTPMNLQLKAPASQGPYDDQGFFERADYAVANLTNPLPTENNLFDLQSTVYTMIRMNISPEAYAEAKNVTRFLFYTMKAAEGIQDFQSQTGQNHISMDYKYEIQDQAMIDLDEAKITLKTISSRYPNATVELS
jgi:hypothetical protein